MAHETRRRRAYALTFRVLAWALVTVYLGQAVLAGQFLSGTYAALRMHQIGGTAADVLVVTAVAIAALLRWRAKGPSWPLWSAAALLAGTQAQNGAGAARLVHLHVPLGVVLLAGAVLVAVFSSRPDRTAGGRREPRTQERQRMEGATSGHHDRATGSARPDNAQAAVDGRAEAR